MGKELAQAPQRNVAKLRETLDSEAMRKQLAMALPKHLTPERFIRVALTAVQKTPQLQQCSQRSLIGAIVEASQLGLEVDGVLGNAYLVPRRNKKTSQWEAGLQIGYKGLVRLAWQSGFVESIHADVVYSTDKFVYESGLDRKLVHVPNWAADNRGDIVAAYAVVRLKDGGYQFAVLSEKELQKHRAMSDARDRGPWVTHGEWMRKKTAIRQVMKLCPTSTEMTQAIALDEQPEYVELSDNVMDITPATEPNDLDELAETLGNVTTEPDMQPEPSAAVDAMAEELFNG